MPGAGHASRSRFRSRARTPVSPALLGPSGPTPPGPLWAAGWAAGATAHIPESPIGQRLQALRAPVALARAGTRSYRKARAPAATPPADALSPSRAGGCSGLYGAPHPIPGGVTEARVLKVTKAVDIDQGPSSCRAAFPTGPNLGLAGLGVLQAPQCFQFFQAAGTQRDGEPEPGGLTPQGEAGPEAGRREEEGVGGGGDAAPQCPRHPVPGYPALAPRPRPSAPREPSPRLSAPTSRPGSAPQPRSRPLPRSPVPGSTAPTATPRPTFRTPVASPLPQARLASPRPQSRPRPGISPSPHSRPARVRIPGPAAPRPASPPPGRVPAAPQAC
ncbi:PREDICTED: basic proline-rich protein-like [Lipotes vexillifer]|uniref:Basic proline-rich protein-like n=1 Tax=Lipotes vexillifer TaxID=118797 RepID=A0A340XAB0_LIPVE|nr:PREDICTED: basic proline-rich protein-like [Lipotes vexillifer]